MQIIFVICIIYSVTTVKLALLKGEKDAHFFLIIYNWHLSFNHRQLKSIADSCAVGHVFMSSVYNLYFYVDRVQFRNIKN